MGGVGRAFGKLILFGEHAAVYGHPAVGISLPEQTTVRLEDRGATGWGLDAIPPGDRDSAARVLERMEPHLPGIILRRNRTVHIESSVPRGVGFGSSAALCVAFARALLQNAGEDPDAIDTDRVWALAHEAEHAFHGRPSGVDTGLSLLGGTCILQPNRRGLPGYTIIPCRGIVIVTGAVRRDETCAALIRGLAERMKSGDLAVKSLIDELGEISLYAARVLYAEGKESARYLGALADAAMGRLRALGLSTSDLEVVLDAARRAGALGAKLSGAGGGGAFYAIAPDAQAAAVIAQGIREASSSAGLSLPCDVRVVTA
jgi:mevalonate kinase